MQICREYGLSSKIFEASALNSMMTYPWPGNIRELRNIVERLMILGGAVISLRDLPAEIREKRGFQGGSVLEQPSLEASSALEPLSTWEAFKSKSEREYLITALKSCKGNISETARVLQIERSTIHKWLKSFHIEKFHYDLDFREALDPKVGEHL